MQQTRLLDGRDQRGLGSSELGWLFGYVLRSREETGDAVRTPPDDAEQLAVGFTDLVGYTELSSRVDDVVLTDIIAQFQSVAFDAIAESGSRAVKLVGDAIMYVAPSAVNVYQAARMIHANRTRLRLPARTGLAYGRALRLAGDFYGPAVNLASRLADVGEPHQILVDESLANRVGNANQFIPTTADLKGLGRTKIFIVGNGAPVKRRPMPHYPHLGDLKVQTTS